jgi:hypothetical protein
MPALHGAGLPRRREWGHSSVGRASRSQGFYLLSHTLRPNFQISSGFNLVWFFCSGDFFPDGEKLATDNPEIPVPNPITEATSVLFKTPVNRGYY